jgi:Ca2+-binding RTX toxin-like protein
MALKLGGVGADILVGTNFADLILGDAGNDVLKGFGGEDILNGGTGADGMAGGDGNDTYYVDSLGDQVIEGAGAGFDTVHSSVDFELTDNVERLYLTGTAANGTGNALNNIMYGNNVANELEGLSGNDFLDGGAGNDALEGGAGEDHLLGGLGADTMFGGTGNDDFIVDDQGDVVWGGDDHDQVWSSVDFGLAPDVEDLFLSGSAVIGLGNNGNNLVWGNEANNILNGFDGVDNIRGHGGDDVIMGGDGVDVLRGGMGRDTLSGGAAFDSFCWDETTETGTTEGTADVITDFNIAEGDRINLGLVDADAYTDGNQAFSFIGQSAFSGTPGEINYYHAGGNTYIQLQTGTSVDVEAVICLQGIHNPELSWFIV